MLISEPAILPYMEHVMIAILISAAVTGGVSAWSIWQTSRNAEYTRQTASAQLALRLRDYWRQANYPKSAAFLDRLYAGKIKKDDPYIRIFLNHLETVAIFWKEKTLLERHVKEFFWPDLIQAVENEHAKQWRERVHERNPDTYSNLVKLLEAMRVWKA